MTPPAGAHTTRRAFVGHLAAGAVAASTVPAAVARLMRAVAVSRPSPAPVVAFFLDQPYLDLTGRDTPYVPPAGLKSGEPLASLSERAFRAQHCWV